MDDQTLREFFMRAAQDRSETQKEIRQVAQLMFSLVQHAKSEAVRKDRLTFIAVGALAVIAGAKEVLTVF